MKLEYILELMQIAQSRLGNGEMEFIAVIDEAIDELKKVIAENAPVRSKGLILENVHEVEFWEKAYLSVFNSNFVNPPQDIADMAVYELRKRLEESDE